MPAKRTFETGRHADQQNHRSHETPDVSPERRYAEEAAVVLESMGLPRAYGKLLGWLLICEPPQQTSGELAAALDLSKGSVSTGMRLLENSKLVRRVAIPGRRGNAYEMSPDAIIRAADSGMHRTFRQLLDRGLDLIGGQDSPRAQRLRETRDFYAFIERELPRLIEEFVRSRQSAQTSEPSRSQHAQAQDRPGVRRSGNEPEEGDRDG